MKSQNFVRPSRRGIRQEDFQSFSSGESSDSSVVRRGQEMSKLVGESLNRNPSLILNKLRYKRQAEEFHGDELKGKNIKKAKSQ